MSGVSIGSARPPALPRRPSVQGRGRPVALIVLLMAVAIAAGLGALGGNNPVVAIAGAGALLLAISMAVRPEMATFVVMGVLYSNAAVIAVQFHGVPAFAALLVPSLLVIPVGFELLVRRRPVVITAALPLIVVFLLVQVASTIFATNVPDAFNTLVTFLVEGIGLYFLITNTVRTAATLRAVVWVLLAVGTFLGLLSFFQDATKTYGNDYGGFAQMSQAVLATDSGSLTGPDLQPRLAGPIGEKNRYAQIMLMLVPMGLFWAMSSRSRLKRFAAVGAAGAASLGVALTFSRGAAVGFAIVLLIMIAMGYIRPIQVIVVGIAMALVVVAVPQYGSRVASLINLTASLTGDPAAGTPDGAVLSRATEGLTAVLVFADHPILGVGPGQFPSFYPLYADEVGIRVLNADRQAHNLYLHVASEEGILGLVTFLAILAVTLRDLVRVRRRWLVLRPDIAAMATGLMLAVVTYMTTGLFLHLSYARYFWIVLALAGAAAHIGLRLADPTAEELAATRNGDEPIRTGLRGLAGRLPVPRLRRPVSARS